MNEQGKSSGDSCKGFLMITEKYYMGHDVFNVIIYTKRVSKKGKVSYGDCKYFPNIKTAINRVMELSEITCIEPDIAEMIAKFDKIRAEVVSALQWIKDRGTHEES